MSIPAEDPGHCRGDAPELASRRWTWVWRAALVLPWGLGGLKLPDLRGETLSTTAVVLTAMCVMALALGSVQVWRVAGAPRLTYTAAVHVHYGLSRAQRRTIHRALHRRGPLPPELRPAAARTVWARRNQITVWFPVVLAGANLMPNDYLLERPGWLATGTVLVALVLVTAVAALMILDRRLCARARELELPLEPGGDRGGVCSTPH